ncbi:hypothetical protein LINPERHAP1_LOCUS36954 [Linum perenne]
MWLEGILQVAFSKGWKFPTDCGNSSPRRSVSVSSFSTAEGRFLKISEACLNGKFFFVLVPTQSSSDGWKSLLTLCQSWIASNLAPPPPVSSTSSTKPPSSFAEVVKGPTLPTHGRCVEVANSGTLGITVEKDGIRDRQLYLECCIVFRFCSQAPIDWTRFRRWANSSWGSALNAPLQKLDDDLWLLYCDSKAKVDRILALNRRSFGDIPIFLDKWIPEAGCSKLLRKEGIVWITIRGIPIHLRSTDLFRQIGMSCGDYLGFEACSSLSSIRLKIRYVRSLPEVIPLHFEGKVFPVEVNLDSEFHSAASEVCQEHRPISSSVFSPLENFCFGSPELFEFGSSSADTLTSPATGPSTGQTRRCLIQKTSSEGTPRGQNIMGTSPFQRSVELSVVSDQLPISLTESSFGGLMLAGNSSLWLVSSSGLVRNTPLLKFGFDLGQGHFNLGPFSYAHLSPYAVKMNGAASFDFLAGQLQRTEQNRSSDLFSTSQDSIVPLSTEQFPAYPTTPDLSSVVVEAAILFDLELNGSKEAGIAAATDTYKEVVSRRATLGGGSRKDREWRRLDFSPDSIISGTRSSRRGVSLSPQ